MSQRRGTLQIKKAEASTTYAPPPTPPVIEPTVGEASGEFIAVIGNITFSILTLISVTNSKSWVQMKRMIRHETTFSQVMKKA